MGKDDNQRPPMTTRQKAPSKDVRSFVPRHIGPSETETQEMLKAIGVASLDALIDATVPESIRLRRPLALPAGLSEHEALSRLRASISKNQVFRSYLGYGYANCLTPPVIQRNILENPGWYTAYTPYQAEIAQGRLEALLNFQTVIVDLTGLEIANASLLDEGTAAAEAMLMCHSVKGGNGDRRASGVRLLAERAVVVHGAVGRRIRDQRAKHLVGERE